jgi:hypothetical protein
MTLLDKLLQRRMLPAYFPSSSSNLFASCKSDVSKPKELWRLSHLSAQLERPAIGGFHLRIPIALGVPHCRWPRVVCRSSTC